jgi:glycerol-3-phosphate O-acyltransferase / dihydroxyacetone phosphate acyltransferase
MAQDIPLPVDASPLRSQAVQTDGRNGTSEPNIPTPKTAPLEPEEPPATAQQQHMPLKQKVAVSFQSLVSSVRRMALGDDGSTGPAPLDSLFAKTDPAVDGDECLHDCGSCTVKYPRNFKVEEQDLLYGHVKGWSTHMLVATGKADWVREVEHEKGSVMEAVGKAAGPSNGVSLIFFPLVKCIF